MQENILFSCVKDTKQKAALLQTVFYLSSGFEISRIRIIQPSAFRMKQIYYQKRSDRNKFRFSDFLF